MPLLLGNCQEVGIVDRLEISVPGHVVQPGDCPLCGQHQVCNVHWREDRFTPYDLEFIRTQEDVPPRHNVFPGGTPGAFQPHLVVFVDHPDFTFEGLEQTLRRRVRLHNNQAFSPEGGAMAVARAHVCAGRPVQDAAQFVAHTDALSRARFLIFRAP